jgi:polyhydroxybutyrate depolymerase
MWFFSYRIVISIVCMFFFSSVLLAAESPYLTGTLLKDTIEYNGIQRGFLIYMPDGDISGRPVFMVLHGSRGTGKDVREQSSYQFDVMADSEKFIVLYPNGYKKHWNGCRSAPQDKAHKKDIDDVGFLTALVEMCSNRWQTDSSRVYAVGFSNGGHMCFRLAIEAPDRIAAIAAVAASMPAPGWSKCSAPQKKIPVMIINGTEDPINPFEGGMVKLLFLIKKGEVLSSMDSARAWLPDDDPGKNPVVEQIVDRNTSDNTHVELLTWPGSQVRLCIIHGGGHTIPGGDQYLPVSLVGRTSRDINIAEEIWSFFVSKNLYGKANSEFRSQNPE